MQRVTHIYKVNCWFSPNENAIRAKEMLVTKETDNYYYAAGKRIAKEEIMKVDNGVWRSDIVNVITRTTYCLESQLTEAKELVRSAVLAEFDKRCNEHEQMKERYFNLKNLPL